MRLILPLTGERPFRRRLVHEPPRKGLGPIRRRRERFNQRSLEARPTRRADLAGPARVSSPQVDLNPLWPGQHPYSLSSAVHGCRRVCSRSSKEEEEEEERVGGHNSPLGAGTPKPPSL